MPTLERLAGQGLRYNRFHTTAPVLADARGHPDGPQPPHQQRRRDHGSRDGIPGQHRRPAAERHAAGRDPPPERLQHVRLREVPRDGPLGGQRVRAVRPLAHAFRFRQVLRLHRRRDESVGAARLRWHGQGGAFARPQLPLHDRHDEPGHPVDPEPAVAHAGQALLHLLRHRRHARAAPRSEGLDCQVQGQVRRRVGQVPRGDFRPAEAAGDRPAKREAGRPARGHQGVGRVERRREAAVRSADGSVRRVCRAHRLRDWPCREGDRGYGRGSTTRWSSTRSATTAPAQKAACPACSTR